MPGNVPPPRLTMRRMDAWSDTFASNTLEEGTFNDDFHVFGLYWDENEMVRPP